MTTYNPDPGSGPAARRGRRVITPGDVFGPDGQLTVVCRVAKRSANRHRYWLCQCKCGKSTQVRHDPSFAEVLSHLEPEEGAELVHLAATSLLHC